MQCKRGTRDQMSCWLCRIIFLFNNATHRMERVCRGVACYGFHSMYRSYLTSFSAFLEVPHSKILRRAQTFYDAEKRSCTSVSAPMQDLLASHAVSNRRNMACSGDSTLYSQSAAIYYKPLEHTLCEDEERLLAVCTNLFFRNID